MKKEMKILLTSLVCIFLISFLAAIVFAADTTDSTEIGKNLGEATSSFMAGVKEFFTAALTPFFGEQELLTKVFFSILLYMILYSIISVIFGSGKYTTWIITLMITIISMIAIPPGFLESLRTSYGAMGLSILAIIPFIIMLFFTVRVQSALVARVLWIFYMFYYLALFAYAIADKGITNINTIPYWAAIGAGLLAFLLVGMLRNAIFLGEMSGVKEQGNKVAKKANLLHRLQKGELREAYEDIGN